MEQIELDSKTNNTIITTTRTTTTDGQPHNKSLDLTRKELTELWFAIWVSEHYLNANAIDLSHNNITKLENFSFAKFSSVKRINVSYNRVSQVDAYAFFELDTRNDTIPRTKSDLYEIDLSNNNLSSIPLRSIVGLNNLVDLYLSRNRITRLDFSSRPNHTWPSLLHIDLSYNMISFVELTILKCLPMILEIDLSHNEIISLWWILTLKFILFEPKKAKVDFILIGNKITKCDVDFVLNNEKNKTNCENLEKNMTDLGKDFLLEKNRTNCDLFYSLNSNYTNEIKKNTKEEVFRITAFINNKTSKINWLTDINRDCVQHSTKFWLFFKIFSSICLIFSFFTFIYTLEICIQHSKLAKA